VVTSSDGRIVALLLYFRVPTSGQKGLRSDGGLHLWVPFVALAAIILSHSVSAAPLKETRRILILNEAGISYPAIDIINRGIQTALQNSPYRLEFYSEYLDTILFPDPDTQQWFRDFYIHKYANRRPDVIITVGPSPLKFMQEVHRRAFSGAPIIFCLPNGSVPGAPALDSDFTGVENDMAPAETLEIALRLQLGTEHVVVVGGVSDFDKQQLSAIKQQLSGFTDRVNITFVTDLAMPDLREHLRHLPNHTVVLLASIGQDAAGTRFKSSETGPMVATAANAPVFSLFDVYINHGEVGGDLSSLSDQGRVAGDMARRILSGEGPRDIPRVKATTTYMFDWQALKRWRLKASNLPPGSVVLNRQPTVWELYKWYIFGGVTLIVLEALLIFALLWQRAGRRKAEKELAITYDRLRQAVEAGKSVGWDWDVKTGRDRWFGDLQTMFGIQSDTYCGDVAEFRRRIYPEDRELAWKAVAEARQNRKPYITEFRVVRNDGTVHWITARGQFYYAANGDAERMLGMAVDITDRKLAEESLATIGRRLIEAHEEERTWIARELHDDVNQRIALVAIELERWSQHLPESAVDLHDHIHHASQRLSDISRDIQALSHRLHSSKLEYLGIVVAANSYCKELSEQHKVRIEFSHSDIPRTLRMEISLCLFRVLQEALQNAVKHSGAQHFKVDLRGTTEEIRLSVSDVGVGFDWQAAMRGRGLGLISMRERLQLVKGDFSVKSEPGRGTTICACVPFAQDQQHRSIAV
jgi:PAS domain S-box-containing protein